MDLSTSGTEKTAAVLDRRKHQPIQPHKIPIDIATVGTDSWNEAFNVSIFQPNMNA